MKFKCGPRTALSKKEEGNGDEFVLICDCVYYWITCIPARFNGIVKWFLKNLHMDSALMLCEGLRVFVVISAIDTTTWFLRAGPGWPGQVGLASSTWTCSVHESCAVNTGNPQAILPWKEALSGFKTFHRTKSTFVQRYRPAYFCHVMLYKTF